MQTASFYVPITKVDKTPEGHRIVTGVMGSERLDLDGQIADYAWLKAAAADWYEYANVREQHNRNAVGKGISLEFDDAARKVTLVSKAVDPVTVMKLDEGVLQGYSFGAKSVPGNPVRIVKDAAAPMGRIRGGKIIEVSYVDRPANEDSRITLAKAADSGLEVVDGMTEELTEADLDKVVEAEVEKTAETESEVVAVAEETDATEKAAEVEPTLVEELEGLLKVATDPEVLKRRVFYARDDRQKIEQLLQQLNVLIAGDMQGPTGTDPAPGGMDAPEVAGDTGDGTDTEFTANALARDGDGNVREPDSVAQQGPDASTPKPPADGSADRPGMPVGDAAPRVALANKAAEPDAGNQDVAAATPEVDKAVEADVATAAEPDITKLVESDVFKAAVDAALKGALTELEERFVEKYASVEKVDTLTGQLEKLAASARPGGPTIGQPKGFPINETIDAGGPPLEILEKMARFEALTKSGNHELAASARQQLNRLQAQYLPAAS